MISPCFIKTSTLLIRLLPIKNEKKRYETGICTDIHRNA